MQDSSPSSKTMLMQQARSGTELHFALREHDAERAGMHLDLVIGDPNHPAIADFVIFKQSFKGLVLGKRNLAKEQPPHDTAEFLLSPIGVRHVIADGYGKGTWQLVLRGTAVPVGQKHSFLLTSSTGTYSFQFYRFNSAKQLWYFVLIPGS